MEKITRTAKIQSLGTLDGMGPHVVLEIDLPGDGHQDALVTGIPLSEEEVVTLANGAGLYGTVRVTISRPTTDKEPVAFDRDAVRAVVERIQDHIERGPAHTELTAATILCSELLEARWPVRMGDGT